MLQTMCVVRHAITVMAENRRPTINSILKDPAASDWLKAAVRSALECDPADVMRDAQTLVTLMIGYTSRFGYPARRQWPREKGCTMMARKRGAAIYVRVSTDKQTVENQGPGASPDC